MRRTIDTFDTQPVKEEELVSLPITGFGDTGDPIVKIGRYIIFIKGCDINNMPKKDDVVEARVTRVLEHFGFAEVI